MNLKPLLRHAAAIHKAISAISLIFTFLLPLSSPAQVLEQDSLALVAFYNSTDGPNWNNNTGWLSEPVSTWYGVVVDDERVKELKFYSDNNLNGEVPEDIGYLAKIETFVIGNNPSVAGNLPASIGQLINLKWFGIGNCSLIGTIPSSIGNCFMLKQLNLGQNNLTGSIPPEIGNLDSLLFLDLRDNQLGGPIPPELGNCSNLLELRLTMNNLTGGLPVELASLNNINTLNVSFNNLSGPVPDEFADQISYWFFYINDNNFDYLPPFNNWYGLVWLKTEKNKLTFEHLESHAQAGYMWFDYSPQAQMLTEIDTAIVPGNNYSIYSGTGGDFTNYKWYKNGELILESPDADTLHLNDVSFADSGTYVCYAENSLLDLLTLQRKPVHVSIDTGVNILNHLANNQVLVYPNPASEKISVLLPFKQGFTDLWIFNLEGKSVLTERKVQVSNSQITTDIRSLKQGIYLLKVKTGNRIISEKLIINKRGTNR